MAFLRTQTGRAILDKGKYIYLSCNSGWQLYLNMGYACIISGNAFERAQNIAQTETVQYTNVRNKYGKNRVN